MISINEYTTDDLLNRQPFIDQVKNIIALLSEQKRSTCFAINGKWGVGKTYVLNKLEKQLKVIQSEDTNTDKYMLFHYNCWQYDYYEEPLVAIVATMLDTIDEDENLISSDSKSKIKGLLKAVGSAFLINANNAIEKKTGFNPQELVDIVTDAGKYSAEQIEEDHKYDSYFIFKSTLKKLQETLKTLSKDKTIIFIVDELDRCLPEYAVKVLERLHHVFEDISNVQVFLSIDKGQLEHIIKNTFGKETKTEKYLAKFINFYLNLDEGSLDEALFDNKFSYYTSRFEYQNEKTMPHEVDEFKARIFDGIDMRSRIEIIDKCNLIHSLLIKDCEKYDCSIMCLEIFFSIIKYIEFEIRKESFNEHVLFTGRDQLPKGLKYFAEMYRQEQSSELRFFATSSYQTYVRTNNVYGLIIAIYRYIIGFEKDQYQYNEYDMNEVKKYITEFQNLLQIIS